MTAETVQEVLKAVATAVRERKDKKPYQWAQPDRAAVANIETTILYRLGMDVGILEAAAKQYNEDFPDRE